jgi:hypothetical protein
MTSRHNFNVCGVIKFTVCFGFIYYHELDNCFGRAVFINLPRRGSSFPTFRVRSFCCVDRCLLNSFQFKCNKGGSCCTRSNKAPKAQQNRFSFIIVTFSIFLGAKRHKTKNCANVSATNLTVSRMVCVFSSRCENKEINTNLVKCLVIEGSERWNFRTGVNKIKNFMNPA